MNNNLHTNIGEKTLSLPLSLWSCLFPVGQVQLSYLGCQSVRSVAGSVSSPEMLLTLSLTASLVLSVSGYFYTNIFNTPGI